MVEPYMGQSTPHLAEDTRGMTMRGHASGQPAIAHLLQDRRQRQQCNLYTGYNTPALQLKRGERALTPVEVAKLAGLSA